MCVDPVALDAEFARDDTRVHEAGWLLGVSKQLHNSLGDSLDDLVAGLGLCCRCLLSHHVLQGQLWAGRFVVTVGGRRFALPHPRTHSAKRPPAGCERRPVPAYLKVAAWKVLAAR